MSKARAATMVKLKELIVDSCYGTSRPSSPDGTTPVVGIPNVREGKVHLTASSHVDLPETEREKLVLRPGDILLMRTNGNREVVGQTGLVETETDAVFASYLVRLRVDTARVIPSYLNHWMNSPAGRHQVQRVITEAGQANVNPSELQRQVRLPLPRLAEQRRVDRMLCLWDAAVEKTEKLIESKRPARIAAALTLQENLDGRWVRIGDVCFLSKGGGLSKRDLGSGARYPCILYGELHTVYAEVITETLSRTDIKSQVTANNGDVLIPSSSETREDLARASALRIDGVLIGGDINILRAKQQDVYDPDYLAFCLTHLARRKIARVAQGYSVVHLYGSDIAALEVKLPSLEKQRRVADVLNLASREVAMLESLESQYRVQRRAIQDAVFGTRTLGTPYDS